MGKGDQVGSPGPEVESRSRARLVPLYLAAITPNMGVHLILPALPLVREELGLSDGGLALLLSIYALPGLLLVIPLGVLADRVGRHRVMSAALLAFGLAAIPQFLFPTYGVLLVGRLIQGAAAAVVMPLTMVIMSDLAKGSDLISAQGGRTIAMKISAASFPVLGGFLVGIAWFAPFGFQVVSLGMALLAWRTLPRLDTKAGSTRAVFVTLGKLLRQPPALALQILAIARFLIRHGYFTYFPLLVVARGMSVATIGVVLGVTEAMGAVAAFATGRVAQKRAPPLLFGASIVVGALALLALGSVDSVVVSAVAGVVFGTVDGVFGVIHNSMLVVATGDDIRGSYVALSSLSKTLGKFLGPITSAALVGWVSMSGAFVGMAMLTASLLLAVPVCLPVFRRLDWRPVTAEVV